MQESHFFGRLIQESTIDSNWLTKSNISFERIPAIKNNVCQRCYTKINLNKTLPNKIKYCQACLQFGRLTSNDTLLHLPEPNRFDRVNKKANVKLTDLQKKIVLEVLAHNKNHLIWAVTGAGKTEILFPIIEKALNEQKRICIATPRIDVLLELKPRINQAFDNVFMNVLYGQSTKKYVYTQLVLCTTHQLLKFKSAFDVLIIDEVDAFPFANNQLLLRSPNRACKKDGRQIFLTATPSLNNLLMTKHKSYLPRRFHGYQLPLIKIRRVNNWHKKIKQKILPKLLLDYIKNNNPKQQCLIFVPIIKDVNLVLDAIKRVFPNLNIKGVSSIDENRNQIVIMMREQKLQYLITTTILERGVTFADIDVIILGADHLNFNDRSLIQIAGRVGRKKTRPNGLVLAIVDNVNIQVLKAKWTIEWLNAQAKKLVDK